MSSLEEIAAQARGVGFHDSLPESELRETLDQLAKWGFAKPFRDYTAPVRNYQGLIVRQEAWVLTRKGRGIVAAVQAAVVDTRFGPPLTRCCRHLDSGLVAVDDRCTISVYLALQGGRSAR
ncbi:hypothetical protein [Nonomuraea dietziae]|uniref:hypothetical protein n=1 Tax=Nonomuraea dietziae TaxID=65515 RepID=UPI00343BA0C0